MRLRPAQLRPLYDFFGVQGRRRKKRRLMGRLFAHRRWAETSAKVVMALVHWSREQLLQAIPQSSVPR